ncbi:MAG: LacI family transcriptional regulator [Clostridiales bacterium]|nr:LacI family transcriptional regulator [Clostridiales bacterium]
MTNIKDIARHCGVAISTVSRVLNDHPDVSDETREKVLQAVNDLHYIPNTSARNLVRTSSDTIALLVKGVSNPFFSKLIKVIVREITLRGYSLELHHMDTSEDELLIGAQLANERKLIGILFLGGRFNYSPEELALINVPSVFCTYTNTFGNLDASAYSSVAIDDKQTARFAVDTLVSLGHRRIAILADNTDDKSISELRFQGYKDALASHGIPFDPVLVACAGTFSDMGAIHRATSELIARDDSFTAIFAIADLMAIAAIKALTDHGKRVPEDCSVVAIDGLELSEYTLPTLTTLVQPVEEMGLACAKTIIERIEKHGENRQFTFHTALRSGGSVRQLDR